MIKMQTSFTYKNVKLRKLRFDLHLTIRPYLRVISRRLSKTVQELTRINLVVDPE